MGGRTNERTREDLKEPPHKLGMSNKHSSICINSRSLPVEVRAPDWLGV